MNGGAHSSGAREGNVKTGTGSDLDVLVIGGGQAGLAIGYHLAQRGLNFAIVDAGSEVGHIWRSRWDSLKLFTAGQFNHLPGMDFPAEPDTYAGKDDVADYLGDYAERFLLPMRLKTTVTRLTKAGDDFLAETTGGPIRAAQVVVATGPFQVPFIPAPADDLDPGLTQLHSASYRSPGDLPEGRVLVVGAANSGQQIALELSQSRDVEIAVGQKLPTLPQRFLGRDLWWWLTTLRIARVRVSSRLGQRLSQRDVVIGGGLKELRRNGVGVRPRVEAAAGRTITFDGGDAADYDGIVWATGYRTDHAWIDVPDAFDHASKIRHVRGVTSAPGLYLLGMTWQHTRTSALLGWVGQDAAYIAERVDASRSAAAAKPAAVVTAS
jgi:putative flavoprotein involved in K+ transport